MNNEVIIVGMLALNVVLAAAAVIQRDRDFFFIWAGWSVISTILLVFIAPVLAVVKLILVVLGTRHLVALYNTIIALDQNCELAIHDVTSSLVRREAVLPRIENFVHQYSSYESSTLINTIRERGGRDAGLAIVFEAYPQLRASDQFTRLASELVSVEESILLARFKFNEAVAAYNRYLRQFPTLLFARAMAFPDRDYITA